MSNSDFKGHPEARRVRRSPLAWINLVLLVIIVIACNYISEREYVRHDLTEDERFTISERTINTLSSERVQSRETPVRIIFAFKQSTPNYARMRALLEEYERYGKGKIEVEYFDPIRQPNRAREISQIYNTQFKQDLCVIDARPNPSEPLLTFSADASESRHVRICPGATFIRYEVLPDGSRRAVALMMDEVVCSSLTKAIEGDMRTMYVIEGKGGVSRDDTALLELLGQINGSLNIGLKPLSLHNLSAIPDDAEGILIVSPQTDFTEEEINLLKDYWNNRGGRNSIFIALNPLQTNLPHLYRFIREQGIRPNADNVMLRESNRPQYDISAVFPKSLNCARSFWNGTTHVDGLTMSLSLEHGDEDLAALRRLSIYPLLMTTPEYYGETRTGREAAFDPSEDIEGPLCIAAAVTKGRPQDPNNLNTLIVIGNTDMLKLENARAEQRDYLRTIWAWMSDRPEYAGKSSNQDLSIKIDLNRHSRSAIEFLTLIFMPGAALLIAFFIWNTRRH